MDSRDVIAYRDRDHIVKAFQNIPVVFEELPKLDLALKADLKIDCNRCGAIKIKNEKCEYCGQ
ncbi:MAG: hypothetical protein GY775_19445 [Candidatus Scalindua sp.]|nr:hypothetical protein [Candidatus Scalindua sp.]